MIAKRPQIEKVLQTLTAKGDYFDVTLGHLGATLRATLGTLWSHRGVTWGVLRHIFGVFSDRFGQIRVTSTSL